MTNIIFICTGNVFRSLSAEQALKSALPPGSNISVASAGTHATYNKPLREDVTERLSHWGVNPSDHKSRLLTREILQSADLVVAMSKDHEAFIEETFGRKPVLYNQIVHGDRRAFPDVWEVVPDFRENTEAARTYIFEAIDTIFSNREAFVSRLPLFLPRRGPSGPPPPAP